MRKMHTAAAVIVLMAIVALIVVAVIRSIGFSLGRLRHIFDALDFQIGIILGMASIVALLCAWLIAAAISSAKQREIEGRRQSERARIYQAVMESLTDRLDGLSGGRSTPVEVLFLRGSIMVLKEYRALLRLLSEANPGAGSVSVLLNRLLLAMRRDSGSATYGLEKEDWSDWLRSAASDPPERDTVSSRRTACVEAETASAGNQL